MDSINKEAVDSIVETILSTVSKAIEKYGKYDRTFTANVIDVLSNQNKCVVMYNGTSYTASTTVDVKLGDLVRVCVPCSNWNDIFVVENRSRR